MLIPIILSADNNYAGQMYVCILSILENRKDKRNKFIFYLTVPSEFNKKNENLIKKLLISNNCEYKFIHLEDQFKSVKRSIERISIPTYYRLLAEHYVSSDIDKCIYLDVDTCVCSDISELFKIDLSNNYLGGVIEPPIAKPASIRAKELNLPSCEKYINAGVLLINLNLIRKDRLTKKFLEMSQNKYPNQDQDILNIACYGKIKIIPCKFNASPRNLFNTKSEAVYSKTEIEEAKNNPVVIHYSDSRKPWNSEIQMSDIWWKYAEKSPFKFVKGMDSPITAFSRKIGYVERIKNQTRFILFGIPIYYENRKESEIRKRFLCFRWTNKIINTNVNTNKKNNKINFPNQSKSIDLEDLRRQIRNDLFDKRRVDVSVVMPVYNTSDFLRKSLDTILNQEYLNYEVICIDDGSTDNSLEILKEYSKKYANLIIKHIENSGAGAARNIGLGIARGEYVIFLDSDDIFESKLVRLSFEKAKETDADIVMFRAKSYLREKNLTEKAEWALNTKYLPNNETFSPTDIADHAFQLYSSCPWNKLIRATLAKQFKFQNIRNANDVYFIYSCLLNSKKIAYLNEYLTIYRRSRPNGLQKTKSNHYKCVFEAWKAVFNAYFKNNNESIYMQTFRNKALESIIYYYNTIDSNNKELMRKDIKSFYKTIGLNLHTEDYYYRLSDYNQLKEILAED